MSFTLVRSVATSRAAARPALLLLSRPASSVSASQAVSTPAANLSNIEASWTTLTPAEQESTFKALEELQKKDWKTLTLDEKKASYYVAFGAHGPRTPILASGSGVKIVGGIVGSILLASAMFYSVRLLGSEKPRTVTKEWQEASTARAIEQKQDPFTGPASEGYKGKGYVA